MSYLYCTIIYSLYPKIFWCQIIFCCSSVLWEPALFKENSNLSWIPACIWKIKKYQSHNQFKKWNYSRYFCVIEGYSIDLVYISIRYEECSWSTPVFLSEHMPHTGRYQLHHIPLPWIPGRSYIDLKEEILINSGKNPRSLSMPCRDCTLSPQNNK